MASGAVITRHLSAIGRWELAEATPPPALRAYVRRYVGWFEHATAPLVRRELPTEEAPLIINFGGTFRLYDVGNPARFDDVGSFVTGAYDKSQLVGSSGATGGVQVDLTLLGMRRLLGHPLQELTNRAVDAADVLGAPARELAGQLHDAGTWDARFAIVDRVLMARVLASHTIPAGVLCAWERLTASHGGITFAPLWTRSGGVRSI